MDDSIHKILVNLEGVILASQDLLCNPSCRLVLTAAGVIQTGKWRCIGALDILGEGRPPRVQETCPLTSNLYSETSLHDLMYRRPMECQQYRFWESQKQGMTFCAWLLPSCIPIFQYTQKGQPELGPRKITTLVSQQDVSGIPYSGQQTWTGRVWNQCSFPVTLRNVALSD